MRCRWQLATPTVEQSMSAKQNCHIILPLLTAFFLTSGLWATAQRNQAKQTRFVNFENSPVALEELGNSHQVRNASSKTVVKFTLACLITPNGKPSAVLLKFPAKETDIAPGEASGEIRVDSPSSSEICAARKAKLALSVQQKKIWKEHGPPATAPK
jgi:hypothetical protein